MSKFPKWDDKFINDNDTPTWAEPKSSKTSKRHCFVDNISLCGRHTGYDNQTVIASGAVYEVPHTVCKICYKKWDKTYCAK